MSNTNRSGKNFSPSVRYAILQRDNFTCRYCGATAPDVKLQVDHVVPVALGGSNDPSNGVTACRKCNSGKSATPPSPDVARQVSDDQQRMRDMVCRALGYELEPGVSCEEYVSRFDALWEKVGLIPDGKPDDYAKTLKHWRDRGFPWQGVQGAFAIAYNWAAEPRNQGVDYDWFYRYFCKIVWTHLKDAEALVQESMRLVSA